VHCQGALRIGREARNPFDEDGGTMMQCTVISGFIFNESLQSPVF
jgi:hypothetical protein